MRSTLFFFRLFSLYILGDTFGRPKFSEFRIRLRYAEFDPVRGSEPFVHPVLKAGEVPDLFIVQFRAKSAESWRESIELMGGVRTSGTQGLCF